MPYINYEWYYRHNDPRREERLESYKKYLNDIKASIPSSVYDFSWISLHDLHIGDSMYIAEVGMVVNIGWYQISFIGSADTNMFRDNITSKWLYHEVCIRSPGLFTCHFVIECEDLLIHFKDISVYDFGKRKQVIMPSCANTKEQRRNRK